MFIYKITNKLDGKSYIGQTIKSIENRWKRHIYSIKKHRGDTCLSRAISKHGIENFTIEEIGGANSQEELNYQEWLSVYKFNTLAPSGYNMKEGGGARGKYTKQIKEKISKANRKRVWTEDMKQKMSESIKEWHVKNPQVRSQEARDKISKANRNTWNNKPHLRDKAMAKMQEHNKKTSKRLYCVELGKTFDSIKQAARELGINPAYISQTAKGIYKKAKGLTFKVMDDCQLH